MYHAVKHLVTNSKNSTERNKNLPAKIHLFTALGLIKTPGDKLIDAGYAKSLSDDIVTLISSL